MRFHSRFLAVIAAVVALVQIGVLFSMIAGRAAILRDGREVMLDVLPVDPRDLLRGDYVRLAYNISRVPIEVFEPVPADSGDLQTDTVFVRVRAGADGIWQPVAARFGAAPRTARGADEVDIRGAANVRNIDHAEFVAVDYGIERFYLPEGEGKAIEANLRERNFRMAVAVGEDGTAQIKSFFDGGTRIFSEPLY